MSEPTKATPDLLLWIDSINKSQVNESVLYVVLQSTQLIQMLCTHQWEQVPQQIQI